MSIESAVLGKYRRLCEEVRRYDDLYRQGQSPISDEMYDSLEAALGEMEAAYPDLKPTVGQPDLPPTWSLERTFKETDVRAFDSTIRSRLSFAELLEYVVEPKIDGWSVYVVYRDTKLVSVRTRGSQGKPYNITSRIHRCPAVLWQLSAKHQRLPGYLELRGEATISLSAFASINRERRRQRLEVLRTPFACVTHLLSGTEQLPNSNGKLPLEIHYHEVLAADIPLPNTYDELMTLIQEWGLTTVPLRSTCLGIEQVLAQFEELLVARDRFDYEMDGVVLKVNRIDLQHQLGGKVIKQGGREKRLPLWALAYKFPYRGELGTVTRLVPTKRLQRPDPFEFEVHLQDVAEPVHTTLDPDAGLHWWDICAGDVVRIQRPLGKTIQIVGIEARNTTRPNLKGVTFTLLEELPALKRDLATEVIRLRGGQVTDSVGPDSDFIVMDVLKSPPGARDLEKVSGRVIGEKELLCMLGLENSSQETLPVQLSFFGGV